MRQVLLDPVDQLDLLSQNLLRSLAPPASSTSKLPLAPSISSFLDCDARLADAVQEARVHQSKQREIDELTAEVLELDSHLREIITFLADGKDMLAEIITQGDERLQAIEMASKGNVSYSLALGYASILANFTSAPPTMDRQHPDKPFDVVFRPPFPTEEMMRKGKMNEEAPLGSLGETREVGRPLSPSAIPQRASNADQYSQQSHALAQGVPTQYSTYNHHPPSGAKDDLFDLDLNPDF